MNKESLLAGAKDWSGRGTTSAHVPAAAAVFENARQRLIPRVVYQIAIGYQVPETLRAVRDYLIQANPSWRFELLGEEAIMQFIAEHYGPAMLARFRCIRPEYNVARADLARYLLIYRLGGLYLDLKSTANRPLDEVIRPDDCCILSQWRNKRGEEHFNFGLDPGVANVPGGALQQWFVASVPGHPFLGAVIRAVCERIDRYDPWRDGVGLTGVLKLTGPVAYTKAIWPIRHLFPHRLLRNEAEAGLVYSAVGGLSHRVLTAGHYVRRRTPIIGPVPIRVVGFALSRWQHLRDQPWIWRLRSRRIAGWLVRHLPST